MKRITVAITVADDYPRHAHRWIKDDMIVAAMKRVEEEALDVTLIEAKIGNVRRGA